MLETQGHCARCRELFEDPDSFTIDHIIPRGLGLKYSYYSKPDNRQLLCYNCQRIKAVLEQSFARRIDSRKNSYLLLLNGHAEDYLW